MKRKYIMCGKSLHSFNNFLFLYRHSQQETKGPPERFIPKFVHPFAHKTSIFSTLEGYMANGDSKSGGLLSKSIDKVFNSLNNEKLKNTEFSIIQKKLIKNGNKESMCNQSINIETNEDLEIYFKRKL